MEGLLVVETEVEVEKGTGVEEVEGGGGNWKGFEEEGFAEKLPE